MAVANVLASLEVRIVLMDMLYLNTLCANSAAFEQWIAPVFSFYTYLFSGL
jgi:hypothetical protein